MLRPLGRPVDPGAAAALGRSLFRAVPLPCAHEKEASMFAGYDADLRILFTAFLPRLLGALAILVIGWLVALVAASLTRSVLHRTSFDNRLATWVAGEGG